MTEDPPNGSAELDGKATQAVPLEEDGQMTAERPNQWRMMIKSRKKKKTTAEKASPSKDEEEEAKAGLGSYFVTLTGAYGLSFDFHKFQMVSNNANHRCS